MAIADGASEVSGRHVIPGVFIVSNHQDASVVTVCGKNDEVMEVLKVSVVLRQDGPPVTNGVSQVGLVARSGQSDIGGDLDIVPITAQQSNQARIDAVVVDVQPH